jgi:RimJ/RimL family protein N-acetyltransferase
MKITGLSLTLESLDKARLEMLRQWRNDADVSRHLIRKTTISQTEQINWFNSIDPETNLYLIIVVSGQSVGLIALKDIDWENSSAETSILIGGNKAKAKPWPVLAAILLSEFGFKVLGLNRIVSHVFSQNGPAIKLNKTLGFYEVDKADDGMITQISTPDFFRTALEKLLPKIERCYGRLNDIRIELDVDSHQGRIHKACDQWLNRSTL